MTEPRLLPIRTQPNGAALPERLRQLDRTRLAAYRENLGFYEGRQWPGRPRRGERRLTFNYARALVDKVTSYLLSGASVQVEPTLPGSDAADRARSAERALRAVEAASGLSSLDFETELDCAVLGDAAYRVTWDPARRTVEVTAPDVQGIWTWRDAGNPARVNALATQFRLHSGLSDDSDVLVTELWSDNEVERWLDNRLVERAANPYGFIPFVVFPNIREPKQPWGSSDIPPLVESNRELNRAFSQLSQILEISGNPIAVLEGVSGTRDIAIEPGAVWEVPEKARAYVLDLLQGGGIALHRDYIDLVYRTLHDLGESPRTAFGHNPGGLSGVALNTELDPIAKKVARKRLLRTAVYELRAQMILRLLARFDGLDIADVRPVMQWGPVLPIDRSRQVADERTLVQAGISSRRSAAARLGSEDAETEWTRTLEERQAETR